MQKTDINFTKYHKFYYDNKLITRYMLSYIFTSFMISIPFLLLLMIVFEESENIYEHIIIIFIFICCAALFFYFLFISIDLFVEKLFFGKTCVSVSPEDGILCINLFGHFSLLKDDILSFSVVRGRNNAGIVFINLTSHGQKKLKISLFHSIVWRLISFMNFRTKDSNLIIIYAFVIHDSWRLLHLLGSGKNIIGIEHDIS